MSTFTRRELLGSAVGAATVASAGNPAAAIAGTSVSSGAYPEAPYRSMREYVAALEAHKLVIRIPRVDQDAYEGTALMYRARDLYGMRGAPSFIFEEVRINGRWVKGPLLINESGHGWGESLIFGLAPVDDGPVLINPFNSYRQARDHVGRMIADNGGEYPTIDPVEIAAANAPCKEVILTGDAIDLTRFAFIQCNPADAGRYINTGCVFTRHPEYGVNFGTYRCHLRGPREIGLLTSVGQTGYRHLMAARSRGEKIGRVSIVLTPDPYVWSITGSKMSYGGEGIVDELSMAGGLAGRPIEVVRSETNDLRVPAHAEMVIEGEVPLDDLRPEGPYGEMVGYIGAAFKEVFWMRVTAVTHRRDPWIMNNFTGVQAGTPMAARHARPFYLLKQKFPEIVDWFPDTQSVGTTYISIEKTRPGQGLEVAKAILEADYFAKIVIVFDADIDVMDQRDVLAAIGARWQPWGNHQVYESMPALPIDPSIVTPGKGSKIAIDATIQWPEEGGRENFPALNRSRLEEGAPEAFARMDEKYRELLLNWRPVRV
ncbi:MAG: UbiD family decarboxylase [Gammaproteobacteria bacterium]|nr:MAG: UbiD family decarboxylase [Gammaproteobacteria bacterium]